MSDSNRIRLAYVAESAFGVTPSTPTLKIIRLTKESLKQDTSSITSSELRSDRQVSDVVRSDVGASGDVEGEVSYGTYDDWLMYGLQSAGWSSPVTVGPISSASAAASDNSFNGTGIGTGIVNNQWIKVTGCTTNGTLIFCKVVTATANKIIVKGITLINESSLTLTVVLGAQIVNGTTLTTMAVERKYADLSSIFAMYNGMAVGSFDVTVPTTGILTCKFSLQGTTEASATSEVGSSYTAATTTSVMESIDNVTEILENYAVQGATQFSINLTNNIRKRSQIGTLGAVSLGSGTVNVSGSFAMYFTSAAIMAKYLADTASAIAVVLKDAAGNAYVVDVPRVKYSSGERVAGGINTDIIATLNWTAMMDPTESITIRVARFAA